MSRRAWRNIEEVLRHDSVPPARDAGAFWEDFRARARLRNRHEPAPRVALQPARWALASACALILVAAVFVTLKGGAPRDVGTIRSLDVVASHSAVLIMQDEPSDATILWVVDMELNGANGGSI